MQPMVRIATQQDAEAVAEVIRLAFRGIAERFALTPENCPRHPSNCTAEWIEADLDKGKQYFLLEIDGRPTGCVAVARQGPHTGMIERLAVLPEACGRGCGHMLLLRAVEALRGMGLIRAELAIIAERADLREWYERRGFAVIQTRQFPHLPFSVAFMAKDL